MSLSREEQAKREQVESWSKKLGIIKDDPYMGPATLDDALEGSRFTSQAEVLGRLLARESLFISGLAGSGKTTVINRFIELIEAEYQGVFNIAVTASTGVAATLIGGRTIHSWAGLGISTAPFDRNNLDRGMWGARERMKEADVLVLDEISMMPAYLFVKLDAAMRWARNSKEPFGGVQLVVIGDFLQLPPVPDRDKSVDSRFAIQTDVWKQCGFRYCFMDKPMRAVDKRLRRLLNDLASGKVTDVTRSLVYSRMDVTPDADKVYARLFTTNKNVDNYNQERLDALPGIANTFVADTTGPADKVAKLYKSSAVPERVSFKPGAIVMLTKNMQDDGLANGSIGVVTGVDQKTITVKFNDGKVMSFFKSVIASLEEEVPTTSVLVTKSGKTRTVKSKVKMTTATISQVPLKLAFAITVHKSQGQTFDGIVADVSKAFQPGLGYVALSRVRTLDDLIIEGFSEKAYRVNEASLTITKGVKYRAREARQNFLGVRDHYERLIISEEARQLYWDVEDKRGYKHIPEPQAATVNAEAHPDPDSD